MIARLALGVHDYTMTRFIHLHVHSHYSLLTAPAKIDDLLDQAKAYGMTALALTDNTALYGAIEFYTHAKEKGIKPGDRVKVWSNRGFIKAVAVVTKRITPLQVNGKTVHHAFASAKRLYDILPRDTRGEVMKRLCQCFGAPDAKSIHPREPGRVRDHFRVSGQGSPGTQR